MRTYNHVYSKKYAADYRAGLRRKQSAGPVREHIQALLDAGATTSSIAQAAGVAADTVSKAVRQPRPTMQRATAGRILAVTRAQAIVGRRTVPALGARRRIHALQAIGWSLRELDARTTVQTRKVAIPGMYERIGIDMHAEIVRLYDELWDTPGPSTRARARALARGYAPPMAWDDDTIDDPTARPLGAAREKAA